MARKVTKQQLSENPTFTVKAELSFEVEGERIKDSYEIIYYALSSKVMREITDDPDAEVTDKNRNVVAEQLAAIVKQIPDVVDEDSEGNEIPAAMTTEFFDGLSLDNLNSIFLAIRDDISPNESPSSSAPST
jgi:hypothetical protein